MDYLVDNYKDRLVDDIGQARFEHCYRVMKESVRLAKLYGVDEKKAAIAGLLHDCGRLLDKSKLYDLATKVGIISENNVKNTRALLHAELGYYIAKEKYNILDEDVLNAIKYHTTGNVDMSDLDKIVFIADYIEPQRSFDGVKYARELANKNLDEALLFALDSTLKYIIDNKGYIDLRTIDTRNNLITKYF